MVGWHLTQKFPDDSTRREYDVFEEFPDGSTVWRACIFGMQNVELKLLELSRGSRNKLFALSLQDRDNAVVHPRLSRPSSI
jgi:hypothetical protein